MKLDQVNPVVACTRITVKMEARRNERNICWIFVFDVEATLDECCIKY